MNKSRILRVENVLSNQFRFAMAWDSWFIDEFMEFTEDNALLDEIKHGQVILQTPLGNQLMNDGDYAIKIGDSFYVCEKNAFPNVYRTL